MGRLLVLLVLGVSLPMVACDDNTPVCVPKTVAPCTCFTAGSGTKTCDDTGQTYSDCSCTPDGGVPDASSAEVRKTD